MGDTVFRQRLVGGIGLDQQPVGGHTPEHLALPFFSLMGKVPGKAKVGAQLGQRLDHLSRAAVAVEQKSTIRCPVFPEQLEEPSPRLEAMYADGKIAPGGEAQLGEKNLLLLVVG